jgi:hypothetical protein
MASPAGMTCGPICFRFMPPVAEEGMGTTAGCAAAAGLTAQDPAAAVGVNLADTGCVATAGGLGQPWLRKEGLGDPLNLFCRLDAFAGSIRALFLEEKGRAPVPFY